MYNIWVERPVPPSFLPMFEGVATISGPSTLTPDAPLSALHGADAVLAGSKIIYDASLFEQFPTLKIVSRVGIGMDNVIIPDATARGVLVTNTPDGPTVSTAEHALALMFAVSKRILQADRATRAGTLSAFSSGTPGIEFLGQTLGLVGFGRIGRVVAKVALALGMTVIVYDPLVPVAQMQALGVESVPSLEALLRKADIVSLHLPITNETRNLINAERLDMMKKGSVLINAARGGVVDEAALVEALQSGHLRGAGLDVFQVEPPDPKNPLLALDNVVVTPHIASSTAAGLEKMWRGAITQTIQALNGEKPANLANPEAWRAAK